MSDGSSEKKLEQIPLKKLVCALSIGPWPRSDICVEHEGSIHKRWASKRALCLGRGLPCSCPALPLHKGKTAMHTARISRTTKTLENTKTISHFMLDLLSFQNKQHPHIANPLLHDEGSEQTPPHLAISINLFKIQCMESCKRWFWVLNKRQRTPKHEVVEEPLLRVQIVEPPRQSNSVVQGLVQP